jgi:hypothetical protein
MFAPAFREAPYFGQQCFHRLRSADLVMGLDHAHPYKQSGNGRRLYLRIFLPMRAVFVEARFILL